MITDKALTKSQIACSTSVDKFNSTFKTLKDYIRIENENYYPEYILCIAKLTYNKMLENGLWTAHSNIRYSSLVVSANCWNFGGMGRNAFECPSKENELQS